jgi:hypothetical protein
MASVLIASVFLGHDHTAMRTWALLAVVIAFLPMTMWLFGSANHTLRGRPAEPVAADTTPTDPAAESADPDQLVLGGTR